MLFLNKTRSTRAVSILLMLVVSFVAVGGCVACFAQQPNQQESACCKHNKNCDQKPAPQSGERCLTQSVDFGSTEGVHSSVPVYLAAIPVTEPLAASCVDFDHTSTAASSEPCPHISPHDRLSLISSFLI
jgi:hypothetical protein